MKRNIGLESFAETLNNLDNKLPKSRGRCFDIGTWGGCGVNCGAFLDGECTEPQEMGISELIKEHGFEDAADVLEYYGIYIRSVRADELHKGPTVGGYK